MRTLFRYVIRGLAVALLLGVSVVAQAQTILNTTTNSAALNDSDSTFVVGSTANITAGDSLFAPRSGEVMRVIAVPVSGTVQVRRGAAGPSTRTKSLAASSTLIIIDTTESDALITFDPFGACTRGSGIALYSPVINTRTGMVWVCRSSLWQGTSQTLVTYDSLAPFTP